MRQQLETTQPSGTVSILLAEDDKIIRTLLKTIIHQRFPAVPVFLAENGWAGVELFTRHAPKIVITDINMPGMNGIEMAREIRSIGAATRIIVVTAYDEAEVYAAFNKIGIDAFIVKPISFEKFFAAIEECLAEVALAS